MLTKGLTQAASRFKSAIDRRTRLHFIHIGKNAGTQITGIGAQINRSSRKYRFVKHSHHSTVGLIPAGESYFFSIRNPVSRFKSGFYSRKRKGQPRIYSEWSPHEALAFAAFEHANDLAEALFERSDKGKAAYCAMQSIQHVSRPQQHSIFKDGFFLDLRPPVFILRQENLEADMARLWEVLKLDVSVSLTSDPLKAHKNDYSDIPALSDKAIANLQKWYAADVEFYHMCEMWIEKQME